MFEQIVRDKLNLLGCYMLQDDPEFQDYMNKMQLVITSLDENLISLAIVNYLCFHKKDGTKQQ